MFCQIGKRVRSAVRGCAGMCGDVRGCAGMRRKEEEDEYE